MSLWTLGPEDRLQGFRRNLFIKKISSNTEDIFLAIGHQVESGVYIFPIGFYFKFAMPLRTLGPDDRLEKFRRNLFVEKISSNTKNIFWTS